MLCPLCCGRVQGEQGCRSWKISWQALWQPQGGTHRTHKPALFFAAWAALQSDCSLGIRVCGASGPLVLNELGRGAWVRVTLSSLGSHAASLVRRPLWFPVQLPTDCLLGRHLAAIFCTAGLCWSHQLGRLWGRMTLKWPEAQEGEKLEQQKPGRFLASRCLPSSGSFCAGCCLDENGRTVAGALCTQVWPLGKHCLAPCESAAVVAFLSLCSRFITLAELIVKCLDCFFLLPFPPFLFLFVVMAITLLKCLP